MSNFILSNYVEPILLKTRENSCNCSSFELNGKEYIISRNVSYYLGEDISFLVNDRFTTRNFLYEVINNEGDLKFIKELKSPLGDKNSRWYGYEDIRTMKWGDEVFFSCTTCNGNVDDGTMTFGKIVDLDLHVLKQIRTSNRREKNWVPIELVPNSYVYSFDPLVIVNTESEIFTGRREWKGMHISGSSPLIEYNDRYLALVHKKSRDCVYTHKFIELDGNMNVVRESDEFSFFGAKTEFCVDIRMINGRIRILPSVNDGLSFIFEVTSEQMESILNREFRNNKKSNIYDLFYACSRFISKEVAVVSAIYSSSSENKEDAKKLLTMTKFNTDQRNKIHRRL